MPVWSVAWNSDGSRLASAGADKTIKIWDPRRRPEAVTIDRAGARCLAWAPQGRRLAWSDGARIKVWDPVAESVLLSLEIPVDVLAWSPDGGRLAAAGWERGAVLDLTTRKQLAPLRGWAMNGMPWSPDSSRFALAQYPDQTIDVVNASTGEPILSRLAPGHGTSVAWSPDGSRVACGGKRGVLIIEAKTGRELLTFAGPTQGEVYGVAWSPDGKRLVSGGYDQLVRVWDALTGKELLTLRGHAGDVAASWPGARMDKG